MLITVNGLITRSYASGDHDRVVHMITEDRGRLAVMGKGGNSKRGSPAAACTQLFTYGNYELYSSNGGVKLGKVLVHLLDHRCFTILFV